MKCRVSGTIPQTGVLTLALCLTLVPREERGDRPGRGHWHVPSTCVQTSSGDAEPHIPPPNPAASPAQEVPAWLVTPPPPTAAWNSHAGLFPLWIKNIYAT